MMPGTPQQNGKAEQFNHMILDKAMSMLHTAGLSNGFWEYAISTTVHVYNRSPFRNLQWCTSIVIWNAGHIPDVLYFFIFRCKGYMHVPTDKCHKLDAKATMVTFIRYEPGSKGYRLWDKHTCSIHLSWDVTFDNSSFPSLSGKEPCHTPTPIKEPAIVIPNPIAKPEMQAPSPAPLNSSKEAVKDLLNRQTAQPLTPPIRRSTPPTTPDQNQSTPISPPPCQRATHFENRSPSPNLELSGGFNDRLQQAQILHKMDNVPR